MKFTRFARMAPALSLAMVLGFAGHARGEVVATGTLRLCLIYSSPTYPAGSYRSDLFGYGSFGSSRIDWDNVALTPFGVPVNFGQAVGRSYLDGSAVAGEFSSTDIAAVSPFAYACNESGAYLCTDPNCYGTTFVGTYDSHAGTAFAGLPADAVYTFDGSSGILGTGGGSGTSCALYVGHVTINAYLPVATGASPVGCEATNSCAVEVTQSIDYTFPDGTTGTADCAITYPAVITPGTTTVSALSDSAGELPADVAVDVGGYHATYFELQTTAVYDTSAGPIEVCFGYDLTGTDFLPSQLRFLHRENGVFVDRTSRIDEIAHQVCGALMSFSPVVIAVEPECLVDADCADGVPCTDDVCVSNKCQNVPVTPCKPCAQASDCDDANPCTDDACDGLQRCQNTLPTCRQATTTTLKFKSDASDVTKSKLTWKMSGPGMQFGNPATTANYTLCLLDGSNLLMSAEAPAGGTCGTKDCWTTKTGSAIYKDGELTPDGISSLKLKANTSKGEAKIVLNAKGENLHLPATPVALPLTVMLRRSDDATKCWAATIPGAGTNADGSFKY